MREATEQILRRVEPRTHAPSAYPARAYGTHSATSELVPLAITRRTPQAHDVQIEVLYCGVCHSDLHTARNEWRTYAETVYPCVPGHEIVGRVVRTGRAVRSFREGDLAAVGCMVDSCRACTSCREGQQQYCDNGPTLTYNSPDPHLGGITMGGYSESIVVDEAFVLRLPEALDLAAAAPLLCAGITTYSPLRRWNVRRGQKVGVVGLGGLGHMAVKFLHAFGARVVLFTTSPHKADDAIRLGASDVVISNREAEMVKQQRSFDFVIDTVSAPHHLGAYLDLLKRDGTLTLVGAPDTPLPLSPFDLIAKRRMVAGSTIGGIRETQEMLDFCADQGIVSDIEMIPIQRINEAFDRMVRSDVAYRFVIDMATLRTLGT